MARIYEKKKREGWFQRFFLPLRVKIPMQALAMAFVVVLSVYVYRSTTPELAHLARPQQAPRASGAVDGAARTQAAPEERTLNRVQNRRKEKQRRRLKRHLNNQQKKHLNGRRRANRIAYPALNPGDAGIPPVRSAKGAASDHALKKESVSPAAVPPSPAKMERYKTRGMTSRRTRVPNIRVLPGPCHRKHRAGLP